jgi:hypothetical protein
MQQQRRKSRCRQSCIHCISGTLQKLRNINRLIGYDFNVPNGVRITRFSKATQLFNHFERNYHEISFDYFTSIGC